MSEIKREVFARQISPLLDEVYLICKQNDMSFLAYVHVPSEEHPTLTEGIGVMFNDAPPTMNKMCELVNQRPVIEHHPLPEAACDNDSVTS